jgi:hypothetical protein
LFVFFVFFGVFFLVFFFRIFVLFYGFFGNNRFVKRLERKRTGSPVAQPFGGREGHRKRNRIIVEKNPRKQRKIRNWEPSGSTIVGGGRGKMLIFRCHARVQLEERCPSWI